MTIPCKLLLVDDEDLFRDTTADLLRRTGYTVDCAANAAEAVARLAAMQYDLLIADIQMSGNSRLELVLKAKQADRGMPIILATGYPALETAVNAVHLAVAAYLIKPVALEELLAQVESAVSRSRMYRAAADLSRQLRFWQSEADKLEETLREPVNADLAAPAKAMLKTTFEMVAKAFVNFRRVANVLSATGMAERPEEAGGFAGYSEMIENALHETIQALEESKHVFKSKRLKELRHQLQALLGVLEREKAAGAELCCAGPHYRLHAAGRPL